MTARKFRTPVVLDTNVFVRSFKARQKSNANYRIVRLWLIERQLQLIVSSEILLEYLEVFGEVLAMDDERVNGWRQRFEEDDRVTWVNLARRYHESRDPDDNVFLAAADSGRAEFLVTNDNDLLELSSDFQKTLPFRIVRPTSFLTALDRH